MFWWLFIIVLFLVISVGVVCDIIAAKRADELFEKNYGKILDKIKSRGYNGVANY